MTVPPVFSLDDVTPDVIENLRDASERYCNYDYTNAFDSLVVMPERAGVIAGF